MFHNNSEYHANAVHNSVSFIECNLGQLARAQHPLVLKVTLYQNLKNGCHCLTWPGS